MGRDSGIWFTNRYTNRTDWFIHVLDWSDCICSQVNNSMIQKIQSPGNKLQNLEVWFKMNQEQEILETWVQSWLMAWNVSY